MSQHEIERVIGRAATDDAFRQALIDNAREACTGYDLTEEEFDALAQLDNQSLLAFAKTLNERISRSGDSDTIQ